MLFLLRVVEGWLCWLITPRKSLITTLVLVRLAAAQAYKGVSVLGLSDETKYHLHSLKARIRPRAVLATEEAVMGSFLFESFLPEAKEALPTPHIHIRCDVSA